MLSVSVPRVSDIATRAWSGDMAHETGLSPKTVEREFNTGIDVELAQRQWWASRIDPEIAANVIPEFDPDGFEYEASLLNAGESSEPDPITGDFRDLLDLEEKDELGRVFLDAGDLVRIGEINIFELMSMRRKVLLEFIEARTQCGCDRSKGESCIICCVKVSLDTVAVIESDGHDRYFMAKIPDAVARETEILSRYQIRRLRQKFKSGKSAIAFGKN